VRFSAGTPNVRHLFFQPDCPLSVRGARRLRVPDEERSGEQPDPCAGWTHLSVRLRLPRRLSGQTRGKILHQQSHRFGLSVELCPEVRC